jgi:serine phosphatase RsbU (regulator of sigma subunit)
MDSYEAVISELIQRSHRVHPERVAPLLAEQLPRLGLDDVALYLTDLEQRLLVAVPGPGLAERAALDIDDSLGGLAFRTEQTVFGEVVGAGERPAVRLWVPLLDGAERLGVLAVTAVADEVTIRRAGDLASIAAAMVVGKQPYGDGLVNTRRTHEMQIAAELRWDSLPPLTYANDLVEISALLEPAYEVAGDAFDYALNGDMAYLAIFDAMGHGLEASRIANLAVAASRNARRRGSDLDGIFRYVDQIVGSAFGPAKFVTGHLATLDTRNGHLSIINAGHPHGMLLRGAGVVALPVEPRLPMGLGDLVSNRAEFSLQGGDVVLFYTDGVIEARTHDGDMFGADRLARLLGQTAGGGPLAESARQLGHAVLDHQKGELQDDATLMLVRWNGG